MVSGSETPDRVEQHRTFIDAAVAAGVRHLSTSTAIASGELDGVTDDIPTLTGHRARSLDELLAPGR